MRMCSYSCDIHNSTLLSWVSNFGIYNYQDINIWTQHGLQANRTPFNSWLIAFCIVQLHIHRTALHKLFYTFKPLVGYISSLSFTDIILPPIGEVYWMTDNPFRLEGVDKTIHHQLMANRTLTYCFLYCSATHTSNSICVNYFTLSDPGGPYKLIQFQLYTSTSIIVLLTTGSSKCTCLCIYSVFCWPCAVVSLPLDYLSLVPAGV
jgi:hypothetical protein